MGHSKTLIATRNGRGTASYCAPEIFGSEPSVPSYTNKVDIWALGTILYELCTGKTAFDTVSDVIRYSLNEGNPPHVTVLNYRQATARESELWADDINDLNIMRKVACSIGAAFPKLAPDPQFFTDTVSLHLEDMNRYLAWLLQVDPTKRPSIEQVCLHMASNTFLELDHLVFRYAIWIIMI